MPESKERETPTAPAADSAIARVVKDPVSAQVHGLDRWLRCPGRLFGRLRQRQRHHDHQHRERRRRHTGTEQFGKGDIGILNYALTLEYLETAFYKDVVKSGLFKGAELETIKKFGSEEAEHVAALTAAVKQMGGTPAPKPKTKFPLSSAKSVLELALDGREPRRRGLPRPGRQHQEPGRAGLGARDPQRRGPPRLGAQHADRRIDHPDGAFAEPADARNSPQMSRTLHRQLTPQKS